MEGEGLRGVREIRGRKERLVSWRRRRWREATRRPVVMVVGGLEESLKRQVHEESLTVEC
jgi:hypothetical protein